MKYILLTLFFLNVAYARECKPINLKLKEESPEGKTSTANVIFSCHGGYLEIPDNSTIHFITSDDKQICYAERSCGNIQGIQGSLDLTYSTSITYSGTLLDIFTNFFANRAENLPGGLRGGYFVFNIKYGQMEAFCTEMSNPICLPKTRI